MNEWQQKKSAKEVLNWPDLQTLELVGEVSGVATSRDNNVHVFHRVDRIWDMRSIERQSIEYLFN